MVVSDGTFFLVGLSIWIAKKVKKQFEDEAEVDRRILVERALDHGERRVSRKVVKAALDRLDDGERG